MKIVHAYTATLCVLGLGSAAPVLASQAGLKKTEENIIKKAIDIGEKE